MDAAWTPPWWAGCWCWRADRQHQHRHLVIPIWLLLSATRPPVQRLLGYLATIAGFYLVVGVALVLVADAGLQRFGDLANRPAVLWVQLVVGVGPVRAVVAL